MKKDIYTSSRFSGSVGIAKEAGLASAVVHEKILYYCTENDKKKALNQVTISADKLADKLPMLSRRQILYAIDKLTEKGLITASDWRGHTTGSQKTYTIPEDVINTYYRDKIVTVDRTKNVTPDRDKIGTDQDKFGTPPLQNRDGSNNSLIYNIDERNINIEDREPTLPEIFNYHNPLCSMWKQYLPNYITQNEYDKIREMVTDFGFDKTQEYMQDAHKTWGDCGYNNRQLLDKAETMLILWRNEERRKYRGF